MQAIDVHGHFGPYDRGTRALTDRMMSADIETVSRRALACGIRMTVVSAIRALIPYRGDAVRGNEEAVAAAEQQDDIRFWVVIDPLRRETYEQADRFSPIRAAKASRSTRMRTPTRSPRTARRSSRSPGHATRSY